MLPKFRYVVQSVVRTLLLLLATVILGLSPLGFVSVPGFGGAITFLHVPMILAATLESPLAAGIVGAAFGIIAGFRFEEMPMLYHVAVRVLSGLTAGVTFQAICSATEEGSKLTKASLVTAIVGTLTNTVLMCLVALSLGLSQPGPLLSVAFVHGFIEMIVAIVVVTPMTIALGKKS